MAPSLPEWPARTIAVLATVDDRPHAIPVSAPVRADDHTILLGLHRSRDSLARLRRRPQVALLVLAEGNVAFTARGTARIAAEPLADDPDYAAVAIDVTELDDHRQPAFTVEAGVDRTWVDDTEREALGRRVQALHGLAARPVMTSRAGRRGGAAGGPGRPRSRRQARRPRFWARPHRAGRMESRAG